MEKQETSGNVEPTSQFATPTSEPQPYPPWASAQEYPPPTVEPPPAYSLETAYYHAAPLPQQPNQQQQPQVVFSIKC